MIKRKWTPFALAVRAVLLGRGMTQKELVALVAADTGRFIDGGYLYKILTGQRQAPKIVASQHL